jgi:hypothetical protein
VAKEKNQPRISQITRKKKLDSRFAPERFHGNFSSINQSFQSVHPWQKKKTSHGFHRLHGKRN